MLETVCNMWDEFSSHTYVSRRVELFGRDGGKKNHVNIGSKRKKNIDIYNKIIKIETIELESLQNSFVGHIGPPGKSNDLEVLKNIGVLNT